MGMAGLSPLLYFRMTRAPANDLTTNEFQYQKGGAHWLDGF